MEVTESVRLAVYDLSNGMAAGMSAALLGQRIDGIWHTGVLVFGREYFFGGGIQMLPIGEFSRGHNMNPVSVVDMGVTHISSDVFHEYLHSISPRFTASTYNLINNNCNNFSNECTHFLTGIDIPSYIIDLPKIVFATPAGAMLRPMIETMQQNVRGGNGPMDPFGSSYHPHAAQPTIQPQVTCSSSSFHAQPAALPAATEASSECGGKCNVTAADKQQSGMLISRYEPTDIIISGPIKSENKDAGLLKKVIDKFRNLKIVDENGVSRAAVSPDELCILNQAIETLRTKPAEGSVAFPPEEYEVLLRIAMEHPAAQCGCFYVLQLQLLCEANVGNCSLLRQMQNIAHTIDPKATLRYEMSGPARFLAVCSLSNYFSRVPKHSSCPSLMIPTLNILLDICTFYISKDYTDQSYRPELRQWTASLIHNIVAFQLEAGGWTRFNGGDEIHPHLVQILCGVVEDISDEQDVVVLHRRLSAAHTILANFPATRELFKDLGFASVYSDLKAQRSSFLRMLAPAVDMTLQLLQR